MCRFICILKNKYVCDFVIVYEYMCVTMLSEKKCTSICIPFIDAYVHLIITKLCTHIQLRTHKGRYNGTQRNTEHHVSQIWGGGVRKIESWRMRCFLSCWCHSQALIGYLSCASLSSKLMGRGASDRSSATQMSWTARCRQASD